MATLIDDDAYPARIEARQRMFGSTIDCMYLNWYRSKVSPKLPNSLHWNTLERTWDLTGNVPASSFSTGSFSNSSFSTSSFLNCTPEVLFSCLITIHLSGIADDWAHIEMEVPTGGVRIDIRTWTKKLSNRLAISLNH